jgi:hypothetical protein
MGFERMYIVNVDAEFNLKGESPSHIRDKVKTLFGSNFCKIKNIDIKEYEEIIDTLNGHDEKLVEVINILWNTESCRKKFQLIIKSLVLRDLEEFEDKMFEGIEEEKFWNLVEWCDTKFEDCAYNYLHRCADDGDLETIIEFCRHWEKTINGGTRYLTIKGWKE